MSYFNFVNLDGEKDPGTQWENNTMVI